MAELTQVSWLAGNDEGMAARIRGCDWSATPLGPIDTWPRELRFAVNLMLANGFPMAIAWGRDATLLYNDAYAAIIGNHHPHALGQSIDAISPGTRDTYGPVLDRAWHGETVTLHDEPYRFRRTDHLDDAWFTVSFSPLHDEQGQVGGVLSTLFETTARVLAEHALRDRERRYRVLFDAMEEGVGIIERINVPPGQPANFRCVLANPVFAALSGVHDAVGLTMRDVLPGEAEAWFDIYEAVLRTGETAHFRRDLVTIGSTVDVSAFRIDDATGRRIAVVLRDITEHTRAEAERERLLREVETERARLADVFEHAPSLMVIYRGPDHVIEQANAFYRQLSGDRALVGRPIRDLFPAVAGQGPIEALDLVYGTGEPQAVSEARVVIDRDGGQPEEHYLDFVLRALRGPDGAITGVFGQGVLQTERIRAEAALRASEARQAFLLNVSDRLRPLAAAEEIVFEAAQLLGEHLGADRVGYAQAQPDGQTIVVRRNYTNGVPGIEGRYRYDDYGPELLREFRAGRTVVRSDIAGDSTLSDPEKLAHANLQLGATINVPLMKADRLVAVLFIHQRAARAWTADELELVEAVAERTWAAVERARAEEALRQSEERARAMVTATSYVTYRMDANWTVMRQLDGGGFLPDTSHSTTEWLDSYIDPADQELVTTAIARAIESKQLFELEHRVRRVDGSLGWTLSRAVPLLDEQGDIIEWFGAASDITDRKSADAALRQNEERQAFLLQLSDALRPFADPGAIQTAALDLLGEHLGVDRAFYAEIVTDGDIDFYRLDREYRTPGTPSIVGRHPVSAFGRVVTNTYRAGRWMAVSDVETDEALASEDRQAFAAIKIRAFIGVPLIKDDRFVAALGVNQFEARAWQPADVALVEAVAERTWAAVERARAEAALRENEERLQKALSADTVGVLFFDLHGQFADANETFERMCGYSREELRETVHWTALTPPEFMDLTERMAEDLAAYGKAPPYEKQMIHKDGSRWWGLFAPTRLSGRGRESRCVEFIIDITARKRAEAALGESEERYRTLFESIDQGFCTIEVIFDDLGQAIDYRFLEINPAFARSTGLSHARGKRMRELRPAHEQFWFDTYGRVARSGEAERFEEHAHELGRWFNVYAYRIGTPEQHRVAIQFEDITERKRAELAAHESRAELERQAQFLDATLSNVGDYISLWDRQARFVYANRALERLWGRSRLAYAGRSAAELGYAPDQAAFFEKSIASVFRTRRVVTGEISYTSPGGESGYHEVIFSPVTGLGPRPEFVVGVSRDITERKRREARAAFLADVGNDFARLTAPDDIMRVVGEKIYRHFGLDRLAFAYVDEKADTVTSIHDLHAEGLPPPEAVIRLSDYINEAYLRRLRTGQVYALHDIDTDPYAAEHADAFKARDVGALLIAPFVSEDELRFVIALQKTQPYQWPRSDIDLVQDLAPRLYLAIERARAGAAIRESEGRFRAVANLVPDLLWSTDSTGRATWYSQRLLDYAGEPMDKLVRFGWQHLIHIDDREQSSRAFLAAIAAGRPFHREHRLRRHDGEYRWFLLRAEPIHDGAGRIAQWLGTATDIHDTRLVRDELARRVALATTELRSLSRRLILVQEEERRHLARELHDEIGQSLTALKLQISSARHGPTTKLAEAEAIVHELTGRISALSMDLRPAALDTLGLIPALLWHSQRYETQTGVRVDLRHHGLDRRLPPEIEIAAYRVVQEALTNVARHAKIDQVSVQLLADDRLTIVIRDRGQGFDIANTSAAGGLGGMRERVELLGGGFWIEAADGAGVVVTAELPLEPPGPRKQENP